ncbi:MAG: DUF4340 domain-containing protein [Bacteroidota bacterium]
MKKNRIAILIILLLAIVATIIIVTRSTNTLRNKNNDFAIEDSSLVTKIFLSDKNHHSTLLKKIEPGNWTVNDKYAARPDLVNLLLYTLTHIDVKSPISKAAHDNTVKRLSAIGVKVEVYQMTYHINIFGKLKMFPYEKLIKTYYVGDATMDNMGTYMLMEDSKEPYITFLPGFNGYISRQYTPVEAEWRSHKIVSLSINQIKSIQYEDKEDPKQSYLIQRNGRQFGMMQLLSQKFIPEFDTLKVVDLFTSFKNLNFEDALNELNRSFKDTIIAQKPFNVLTITDVDGNVQTIKAFKKPNFTGEVDVSGQVFLFDRDRFYALINKDKDFVLCQYFVFDRMLKPLSYFLQAQ